MPPEKVIQIRRLLAEKFPGIRTRADELEVSSPALWPTGLTEIDELLRGGLCKGGLTEIVAAQSGTGSRLLMCLILRQASYAGQLTAVIDGNDSLEVTQFEPEVLDRLLWVRCQTAEEALKATDLLLRDGNLPLIMLDLAGNPAKQLRQIPATTWYRFQRIIEQTSTVCVVLTPRSMVSPAEVRVVLHFRFSLAALEADAHRLVQELRYEISSGRRAREDARQFA